MAKRVHQHQNVLALVAEILGDGERHMRSLAAHQRRLVGGRDHHNRAGKTGIAEVVLEEFLHFAAAFADQPDHDDVGGAVTRQHRQRHGLADAGAGKMPMRWPRQQVMNVLSARTPRSSGPPTRRRACAGGGVLRNG
jgi:hypothetical protein